MGTGRGLILMHHLVGVGRGNRLFCVLVGLTLLNKHKWLGPGFVVAL